jgi:hypothetical protein
MPELERALVLLLGTQLERKSESLDDTAVAQQSFER